MPRALSASTDRSSERLCSDDSLSQNEFCKGLELLRETGKIGVRRYQKSCANKTLSSIHDHLRCLSLRGCRWSASASPAPTLADRIEHCFRQTDRRAFAYPRLSQRRGPSRRVRRFRMPALLCSLADFGKGGARIRDASFGYFPSPSAAAKSPCARSRPRVGSRRAARALLGNARLTLSQSLRVGPGIGCSTIV